ncbi:DUF5985 family protein [Novosphingobium tardum]|uniref:DUF5985 family protein n=1 Tax=Novosphingobium tardum TaxID=1538021 RepID=A0ABV8RTK9_9SPHN
MATMIDFLSGAITFGFLFAAVFFLRFWRQTGDQLFVAFAVAFAILGLGQAVQVFANIAQEDQSYIYLIRLVAFTSIICAIIWKNRGT